MPIHDVGYRSWKQSLTWGLGRWGIIATTGIRLALKSMWVRRILFVAWLPVMYWGAGFYGVEKALDANTNVIRENTKQFDKDIPKIQNIEQVRNLDRTILQKQLRGKFALLPHAKDLADALDSEEEEVLRNNIWRWLLMVFFRYPQALLILMLVGIVTPNLISQDLRSRAFLLYFSRPIGKFEYILGKLCVPAAFIVAVTTLPALALYLFAVLMSPSFDVIPATWDIPIRILLATVVLVIPTASLALMFSSLTHESRFANFAWFASWSLGHGAWLAIVVATGMRLNNQARSEAVMDDPMVEGWSCLSIYNNLGDVQEWIFGFEPFSDVWRALVVLIAITVASWFIIYRRVSAPVQV